MASQQAIRFSICIPAYKSQHLQACIQSILDQTVEDFELILLNDRSPQPVEEVVKGFSDPRIRYFCNEKNVGAYHLVQNWNKCMDLSQGEYLVIMGDDDLLEPNYLEEFLRLIERYPDLNVYHCRSQIIDEEGNTHLLTPSCPSFETVYDSIWHRLNQLRSNYISDYIYRREALIKQGGFYDLPLAWGSDDITAFIASAERGIAHSNEPVFKYRSHGMSISSTTSNGLVKLEADLGYENWLENFLQTPPESSRNSVIYSHLLRQQKQYMKQRKLYSITKILASQAIPNPLPWLKEREKFHLTARDIFVASIKSRALRNKNH